MPAPIVHRLPDADVSTDLARFRAVRLGGGGGARVVVASDGRIALVSPGGPSPFDGVAVERREDAAREGPATGRARVVPPGDLSGNAFAIVAETEHFAVARWSVAAGRAFTAGPESERWILVEAGNGLLFFDPGETIALPERSLAVAPPGVAVRVFSRDGMRGLVVQPQSEAAAPRSLLGEVRRLRRARAQPG